MSRPPSMEILLSHSGAARLLERYGRDAVKGSLRKLFAGAESLEPARLLSECGKLLEAEFEPEAPRVVNATGVLIHTNLGRAPPSDRTRQAMDEAAGGYY